MIFFSVFWDGGGALCILGKCVRILTWEKWKHKKVLKTQKNSINVQKHSMTLFFVLIKNFHVCTEFLTEIFQDFSAGSF